MELFFFILVFALVVAMGTLGIWKGNPWLTYAACIFGIGLGAILLSSGVDTPQVTFFSIEDLNATNSTITPTYQNIPSTDPLIFSLAYLLIGGGFVFLLFTFYYATIGKARVD